MGIDYDSVGGIGVEITDDVIEQLISQGKITREDWEDDAYAWTERRYAMLGVSVGISRR